MAQRHFLLERLSIWRKLHFSKKHLFDIDLANTGFDITKMREFKEADVIHLHWINQGMLSLRGIKKILDSGKPVVWTMHDVWPATAICHYTKGCRCCQEEVLHMTWHGRCGIESCKFSKTNMFPLLPAADGWKRKPNKVHCFPDIR